MTQEFESSLHEYLGGLMYQLEHEHDWIAKQKIQNKIDAVHTLVTGEKAWLSKALFNHLTKKA